MNRRGIIVGAGIIGSAVAFELSRRKGIQLSVVDPDLTGSLSSSERNAGGVRHLWQQPINMELARASIALFDQVGEEIGFQRTGYLWLFNHEQAGSGTHILNAAKERGLRYEQCSSSQIQERYPLLDKLDDVAFAVFGPNDGLINSNALKEYYRRQARAAGVEFLDRTWVTHIDESSSHAVLQCTHPPDEATALRWLSDGKPENDGKLRKSRLEADFVILCAGAWTGPLLNPWVADPLIQPIRRQICFFEGPQPSRGMGMVVDSSRVYFHPEGGKFLGGVVLKSEPPGLRFDLDSDFFETHIWPALYERSTHFERLKLVSGWGGLYSYTPDTSGILGRVPKTQRIFECHSFTGRGVMQSFGAAIAIADLVEHSEFRKLDASPLHRERFLSPQSNWLHEGLHI